MFPFIEFGSTSGYNLGVMLTVHNHDGHTKWHGHVEINIIKWAIIINVGSDDAVVAKQA